MLVDSHCHLHFTDFSDELGVENAITNAKQFGVDYMLSIATNYEELDGLRNILDDYPNVFGAFGIHPEYANELKAPSVNNFISILSHPKFIGVGETGLDFSVPEMPSLKVQEELFRFHIEIARQTNLPLIIHARDAEYDIMRILNDEMKSSTICGVLHCFTASRNMAFKALDIGFYISASGIITFGKSADELRNTFKCIPLDRILVETDSPFLAPVPKRGGRNEPAFVKFTAEKLADIKGLPFEEIQQVTTDNFFNLFSKAKRI